MSANWCWRVPLERSARAHLSIAKQVTDRYQWHIGPAVDYRLTGKHPYADQKTAEQDNEANPQTHA
jgi:hypothetical protein